MHTRLKNYAAGILLGSAAFFAAGQTTTPTNPKPKPPVVTSDSEPGDPPLCPPDQPNCPYNH